MSTAYRWRTRSNKRGSVAVAGPGLVRAGRRTARWIAGRRSGPAARAVRAHLWHRLHLLEHLLLRVPSAGANCGSLLAVALDDQMRLVIVNQYAAQLFGYSRSELRGEDFFDRLVPQAARAEREQLFHAFIRGQSPTGAYFELPMLTRAGHERVIAWHSAPHTRSEPGVYMAWGIDITSRVEAERQLQWELGVNRALVNLSSALIGAPWELANLASLVLHYALAVSKSQDGFVSVVDAPSGQVLVPSYTDARLFGGQINELGTMVFSADDARGLTWMKCLATRAPEMSRVPLGDTESGSAWCLGVPVMLGTAPVGQIVLISAAGFSCRTVEAVEELAELYALALHHHQIDEDLRRAKREADEASQTKSELVASVSHEIRTPLHGVLSALELAREAAESSRHDCLECLDMARASAEQLLSVINDVLDYSRIDAGKLEPEDAPFDLHTTVRNAIRGLSAIARAKGLELGLTIAPQVPASVSGDAACLRQLLYNLVGNAIKFTERGRVDVQVLLDGTDRDIQQVHFEVRDQGIGIPANRMNKLFRSFSQVDESTRRKYGGTGLGLAICKKMIEQLGGTIGVHSQAGRGSIFWFVMPLRLAPPARRSSSGELFAPVGGPLSGRVLLADDNAINRRLGAEMLRRLGLQVRTASDGAEAVALWESQGFDLILMDVQMPNLDGLEATRRIRERERQLHSRTPVVAMTADVGAASSRRCMQVGMDECVPKPLRPSALRTVLNRFLPCESSPPAAAQTVMDLSFLREALGDDHATLREVVGQFLSDCPRHLASLKQALTLQDARAVERSAHTLRGAVSNFGGQSAMQIALQLETAASQGDLSQAPHLSIKLEQEVGRLCAALQHDLSS